MVATRKQLAAWAALKNRRDRLEQGLFLVEGAKLVAEVQAAGWPIEALLEEPEAIARVSTLRTPPEVLAVVRLPEPAVSDWEPGSLVFLLDGVQDPGNLGTIVRTAAWFGINTVFCSTDSVDLWQPKVLQATMGAFLRVACPVVDPVVWVKGLPPETPVFGTFLEGENLFTAPLPRAGVIILGNEGHGIRPELGALVTRRFTIPQFGSGESLNVAAATVLLGAEFRRRMV
jgi:TrmH family RNA methyltransferase